MAEEKEYTGGSVSYYAVDVNAPINEESDPYTAECQDIIEALKLDFNEGNVLKAIWRRAAARLGRSKKGYDDGLYDAEKIVFYGQRLVAIEQRAKRVALNTDTPTGSCDVGPVAFADPVDIGEVTQAAILNRECRNALCRKFGIAPVSQEDAEKIAADISCPYGPRDAEGWYAWNGDETMRPAGQVFYLMRDGGKGRDNAEDLRWVHNKDDGDILKWRPAQ